MKGQSRAGSCFPFATNISVVVAIASTIGIISVGASAAANAGAGFADVCIAVGIAVNGDISYGHANYTVLAHSHLDFNCPFTAIGFT